MKHYSAEEYRNLLWPEGKPKCRACHRQNLAHIVADYGGELREEFECIDCGAITSASLGKTDDHQPKKRLRIRSRFSKEKRDDRSSKNRGGKSGKDKRDRR